MFLSGSTSQFSECNSLHGSNIYVFKNAEAFTYLYEAYESYFEFEHKIPRLPHKEQTQKKLNLSHFRINKLVDLSINFIYFY